MKKCSKCNTIKEMDLFHKNPTCRDGHASWCKKCQHEFLKQQRKNPKMREKFIFYSYKSAIKKRYGMTVEKYDEILKLQNGVCAICKTSCSHGVSFGKRLSIDHDHTTKFVRGLLCQKCNRGLGLFNDDIEKLKSAIRYIKKSKSNEQKIKTK
jgi:hypothetical protein